MKIISLNKGYHAFILGLLLWCSHMHANYLRPDTVSIPFQAIINGTVADKQGPLPGVNITVKGTSKGTITDEQGRYNIDGEVGEVLIFSFMGYTTQEITISSNVLNVMLSEDSKQLEEVVINAGYYSVKDKERTGSIARVTAKEIETQPVTNALAALQGRMAGVNITQTTGMPGGGFDIKIRGLNSLRNDGNSPLFIIDGVPYASDPIGSNYTMGPKPGATSPLNSINPGDIESIEVLKDADATAIYGSRGANGVVLVTTKKGRAGKTTFTATATGGLSSISKFSDLMDTRQYLQMRRQAYANDGITQYPANAYDVNGTWSQDRYTDWQEELAGRTASFNALQASLSGGSETTQFVLNGNYNRETTVFPGDFRYSKGNLHSGINHRSTDSRFRMSFSANYTVQDNDLPSTDLLREAMILAPNAPALYRSDGSLNWENGTFENPLRNLEGKFISSTKDLMANTSLSYDIAEGLQAKAALGYTDIRHRELVTSPSTMYNPAYGLGSESSLAMASTTSRSSWIAEPQLRYAAEFGPAKLELLAGATFQEQKNNLLTHMGYGFVSNQLIDNPASASLFSVLESTETQYRYQAFFGRANLNWDRRYLLNLTGRRDGSSRFGPDNRFATFGAVGAAWIASEEDFIKEGMPWISFAKIRSSYGTSGSDQIGDYQYLDTYSLTGMPYGGIAGLQPSRLYNPAFGWETNTKFEAALELGFLKDRIYATLAWYRNRSSSQLVGIPLPGTTGFPSIQSNLDAVVQNTGLEITISTKNIIGEKLTWSTDINFSRARNELRSFPGLKGSTYENQFVIGAPLNIVRVYHATGVDPQTGLYQFQDANSDGTIDAINDKVYTKDLNPEFFGGIRNTLTYGPLSLDFLFQFVKQQNFNERFGGLLPGTMSNQPASLAGNWQAPGDSSGVQRFSSGADAQAFQAQTLYSQSDAVISDASYVRLKNVSLTFDLPKEWTKGFRCKLSLQGQNLLTLTNYKGADPEFRISGFIPPLRVYSSSIQISF